MILGRGADFGASFLGGGGAGEGTEPKIPPSTPPRAPPATPPGTPPATPMFALGASSSWICLISLGMTFGCISLPASIWRGMTLTTWGGAAAGGGGGGGGGGGAVISALNCAPGSSSNQISGIITPKPSRRIWIPNEVITVQVVAV